LLPEPVLDLVPMVLLEPELPQVLPQVLQVLPQVLQVLPQVLQVLPQVPQVLPQVLQVLLAHLFAMLLIIVFCLQDLTCQSVLSMKQ
jgi:hypothetical protein